MKSLIAGAAALTLAAVAAPAFAQDLTVPQIYGNAGGAIVDYNSVDVGVLQARAGARFAKYFGVEGEAGFGVNTAQGLFKVRSDFAGYGVAFLPVLPNLDAFARVGWGHDNIRVGGVDGGTNTVSYGGGLQAFITPKDGFRAEYTRHDFTTSGAGAANVWSLAYVRKFN